MIDTNKKERELSLSQFKDHTYDAYVMLGFFSQKIYIP